MENTVILVAFNFSLIGVVGCCYMKLEEHFPLSSYLRSHPTAWRRNYTNSELACHAIGASLIVPILVLRSWPFSVLRKGGGEGMGCDIFELN